MGTEESHVPVVQSARKAAEAMKERLKIQQSEIGRKVAKESVVLTQFTTANTESVERALRASEKVKTTTQEIVGLTERLQVMVRTEMSKLPATKKYFIEVSEYEHGVEVLSVAGILKLLFSNKFIRN